MHPKILIDREFTLHETNGILYGLVAWETAIPQFDFRNVQIVGHSELTGMALSHEYSDVIYFSRNTTRTDIACPNNKRGTFEGIGSYTRSHGDQGVICLEATELDSYTLSNAWGRVTIHEMGHALGLGHWPAPSVMAPNLGDGSETITDADVRRVKEIWEIL
jgi:hypothetical protein